VRAYAGIANDGLMPPLSILRRDHAIPAQRVVSPETARAVRSLLEGVVAAGGTAAHAGVSGYRVAGKTGTVRKNANGNYLEGHHQAVFIGMLPAQHPRLVSLVMIDDPAGDDYYGGAVSGPVFARVMAGAARLLQIPPDSMPAPAGPLAPGTTVAAAAPPPGAVTP
jgi:cell division protein FtsI (penicillin-binding protein 3)